MEKIIWQTKKVSFKELKFNSKNPRVITDDSAKELKRSLMKFQLVEIPVINADGGLIAGHQRVLALLDAEPEYEGDVHYPDRQLEEDEVDELMLKLNTHNGDFDWLKVNSNFSLPKLKGFGLGDKFWKELEANNKPSKIQEDIEKYTQKNKGIYYEKQQETPPEIKELFCEKKQRELFKIIEDEKLENDELSSFLKLCTFRFVEFNYDKIAEYYCHLNDEKTKGIFEKLLIVIIDMENEIMKNYLVFRQETENENE